MLVIHWPVKKDTSYFLDYVNTVERSQDQFVPVLVYVVTEVINIHQLYIWLITSSMGNFEQTVNLISTSLDCGRKPVRLEETHAGKGRRFQLPLKDHSQPSTHHPKDDHVTGGLG